MTTLKNHLIQFVIMFLLGVFFNPMNMLAYSFDHFYLSQTLINGGLLMASNMVWGHEIVHYLQHGMFNTTVFITGIFMSIFITMVLLREQLFVDEYQWLRRMIPHHSTALTTTKKLIQNNDLKQNPKLFRLAKDIIYTQEREILFMKRYLA
jgi:hypothetical protein